MGDPAGYNNYHQHQYAPHGPAIAENHHSYEKDLKEEIFRVIKDASFKNTKAECVCDQLKTLNGDLIKKTFRSFIDDPEFNLFKSGSGF
jgi:hypothetical protein